MQRFYFVYSIYRCKSFAASIQQPSNSETELRKKLEKTELGVSSLSGWQSKICIRVFSSAAKIESIVPTSPDILNLLLFLLQRRPTIHHHYEMQCHTKANKEQRTWINRIARELRFFYLSIFARNNNVYAELHCNKRVHPCQNNFALFFCRKCPSGKENWKRVKRFVISWSTFFTFLLLPGTCTDDLHVFPFLLFAYLQLFDNHNEKIFKELHNFPNEKILSARLIKIKQLKILSFTSHPFLLLFHFSTDSFE